MQAQMDEGRHAPILPPPTGRGVAAGQIDTLCRGCLWCEQGAPFLHPEPPLSNHREFAINTSNHNRSIAISTRTADGQRRLLRRGLMAFVLLGITLFAMSAHACRIEHSSSNTVTIRGECGEAVLMSQLSIAIAQLEARGEAGRASDSGGEKPKKSSRVDLINGAARGSGATFFHRAGGKK